MKRQGTAAPFVSLSLSRCYPPPFRHLLRQLGRSARGQFSRPCFIYGIATFLRCHGYYARTGDYVACRFCNAPIILLFLEFRCRDCHTGNLSLWLQLCWVFEFCFVRYALPCIFFSFLLFALCDLHSARQA